MGRYSMLVRNGRGGIWGCCHDVASTSGAGHSPVASSRLARLGLLVPLFVFLTVFFGACLELDWEDDGLDLLDGRWHMTTVSGDGFNHSREVEIIVAGNTITMVPVLNGEPAYDDSEGGYVSGNSGDFTIVLDLTGPADGVECVEGVTRKEFAGWMNLDTLEGTYEEVRVHRGESCNSDDLQETIIPEGTFRAELVSEADQL